jgi:hypothetical protein
MTKVLSLQEPELTDRSEEPVHTRSATRTCYFHSSPPEPFTSTDHADRALVNGLRRGAVDERHMTRKGLGRFVL